MSDRYDSTPDTQAHIRQVQALLNDVMTDLRRRAVVHDRSKLQEPEKSVFDEYTPKLRDSTYGSDEYKSFLAGMGEGLRHHYAVNDHHPEHFPAQPRHETMVYVDTEYQGDHPITIAYASCVKCNWVDQGDESDVRDAAWTHERVKHVPSGVYAMDLLQIMEMLADWKAATMRHADGDLDRSITQNAERFGYDSNFERMLRRTAQRLGWI